MNAVNSKDSYGLIKKYRVERLGDLAGKHDRCFYFVLDPEHDKAARFALRAYAVAARKDGNQALYDDIQKELKKLTMEIYKDV